MNEKFQNSLKRKQNQAPPIWMMRQAGRYHRHYQNLKKSYSFSQLCLNPSLAAEVALGPIEDFDFDVAILFSDILFPLMSIGVDLVFEEFGGPKLRSPLNLEVLKKAPATEKSIQDLLFQGEAMKQTRKLLPSNKSLIGFVGGPWTLFTYAVQGSHKEGIREAKIKAPQLWAGFDEIITPLLIENIRLQLNGGAEALMILDTAAGELAYEDLESKVIRPLKTIAAQFPNQIGYYSKGLSSEGFEKIQSKIPELAGIGHDQRLNLRESLKNHGQGFVQGNFDPELILLEPPEFQKALRSWWESLQFQNPKDWTGWVCGLGHGLLPPTPEENVRSFVQQIRKWSAEV